MSTPDEDSDAKLAGRVRERFLAILRERSLEGRFPYDGQWLTSEEIDEQLRLEGKRRRVRAVEILLIIAVVNIMIAAVLFVTWQMVY